MRKILALAIFIPTLAFPAAATWTNPSGTTAVAVCAQAGVTCDAPTLATQGISLDNVQGFSITACAATGQTLSGAGVLTAYVYDDAVGLWSRLPRPRPHQLHRHRPLRDLGGHLGGGSCGRVAYVPTALTASSNSVTVYMIAEKRLNGIARRRSA